MARHEGSGTKTISLSLQYNNASGTESYDNIASVDAASGEWAQVANTSYKLPAGSNFSIYVEVDDANASFYFDDAMGGVKGAVINPDGTPSKTASVYNGKSAAVRGHQPQLVTVKSRTLFVNAPADSKIQIKVVNMNGKTAAKFNAKGGSSLSLHKVPAGVYIIEAKRAKEGYSTTSKVTLGPIR
jgi:predicted methyltransferase